MDTFLISFHLIFLNLAYNVFHNNLDKFHFYPNCRMNVWTLDL